MSLLPLWRVAVQVPVSALPDVRQAVLTLDPLAAGGYDQGVFEEAAGIEQFRVLPGTRPAQGTPGQVQRVPSVRLGFYLPRDAARLERLVCDGIAPHHPWRQPVVEVTEVQLWVAAPDRAG